jgi:ATP-dependent helicase HepA
MGSSLTEISAGRFVKTADHRLGIGKCLSVSADEVEIEYFDSISATGRHRVKAHRGQVRAIRLSLQRRCYWFAEGNWRVGRVVWVGDGEYGVRPPNSELDILVPEAELHVRWDKPIYDPTDVLVAHGNESPRFHLCRQPFVSTITAQRAASHGMHGVISSVIELHSHQVEVVRRVLEDPEPRYLLADEVGLGKTIEAGLVIRQYLLDHPGGHVVVITPPLLRRQWVTELREKFLIGDFDRAVISVLAHDKPESWQGGASDGFGRYSPHRQAGLVVVDEVHHLAALAGAAGDDGTRYSALADLASVVPRLLLLSATPLLNNERTFLAMLHLLDPKIYRLGDIEGFQRRIRDRQALGTAFFTFRHDIPPFLIREKVSALRAMFADDDRLSALLDDVSAVVGDPTALQVAVTEARIHISEAYRVHRRVLRNRRSNVLLASFPVRGRQRPESIPVVGRDTAAQEWLDDWRDYVRSTLDRSPGLEAGVRPVFNAFAERAGSYPAVAAAAARYRIRPGADQAREAELTALEQDALRSWEPDPTERELLERGSRLETDPEVAPALVEFLRSARRKTVVFTSFTATARFVAASLVAEFGPDAIATHLADVDPAAVEEELDRFRQVAGSCWILVCDRSAEEGRNLQFTAQAVHYDMPLSPNRLEQRIGRLDRYGHDATIPSWLIPFDPDTIAGAWESCLTGGFHVFDTSIASLQFAVDSLLPELQQALLDEGVAGLARMTGVLPKRLATERQAIAEQDALDAIEVADQGRKIVSALNGLEDRWPGIQQATEGLLCDDPGNLRFHRIVDRKDERYRSYRLTASGKTPRLDSMPLIAWDVLQTRFMPVVKRTGTYFRRAATERGDTCLFRIGDPLIDALANYVRWDDRGQTFAFWRPTRAIPAESLYFRFDYIVEADTESASRVLESGGGKPDRGALQRRADAFLAPVIVTLWCGVDGNEVADASVIDLLSAPFDPMHRDVNLNEERRWALDVLVGESDWEQRCRTARVRSEEVLRSQQSFVAAAQQASVRFEAAARVTLTQRQVRLAFLTARQRVLEEADLATATAVSAKLALGMQQPHVRLDSVGAVVLAPFIPGGRGFGRPRA